jgi:AAA15 family ATPase/GTPase
MEDLSNKLIIRNFKSIRNAVLEDCRRINLLIGKPNVGKSNILEALATFSLPFAKYANNKALQSYIRVENEAELYFNGNTANDIEIQMGEERFCFTSNTSGVTTRLSGSINGKPVVEISRQNIKTIGNQFEKGSKIKTYFFHTPFLFENTPVKFLQPPAGCNLFNVLNALPEVKRELIEILSEYELKLVFDSAGQQIKCWKESASGEVFIVPFNSMADTLQRMIFYKTAIAGNHNSILVFEEPEAHSYPPYISKITADIIHSDNRFFITTHSPYVVGDFIESDLSDLAVFLVDYQQGETVVKRLSDDELVQVHEFGVDLFFNTEMFLKK